MSANDVVIRLLSPVIVFDYATVEILAQFQRRRQIAETVVIRDAISDFFVRHPMSAFTALRIQIDDARFFEFRTRRQPVSGKHAREMRDFQRARAIYNLVIVKGSLGQRVDQFFALYGSRYSPLPL